MVIQESQALGLYWRSRSGRACAAFMLLLALMCLTAAFIYTLVLRLALHAYYTSAHVAALTFILAAFVLSHHLLRVRRLLGLRPRPFTWLQCILNIFYLVMTLALAIGCTIYAAYAINTSLDAVSGACWGWLSVVFIGYLATLTALAARGEWHSSFDMQITRSSFVYQPGHDMPLRDRKKSRFSISYPRSKSMKCKRCPKRSGHVVFGVFYFAFHIIFAVVMIFSVCHVYSVIHDEKYYRSLDNMYTVHVDGRKPVALFLECRGDGPETIVLENGLGGTAFLAWHFIPRFLEKNYKVCVHDRRDIGWSEGFQNEFIPNLWGEKPTPFTSREYFRDLIRRAGIDTPFYYAGHSYGGPHITAMALKYPDLVKGLIFLDSSQFSTIDKYGGWLELAANFQPMGVIRMTSAVVDLEKHFSDFALSEMPEDLREKLMATMKSSQYWEGLFREYYFLKKENRNPVQELSDMLAAQNASINVPVLVVDAGWRSEWFPGQFFPLYNSTFNLMVRGASHTSLIYTNVYGNITAQNMHAFIRYQEDDLYTLEDFVNDTSASATQDFPIREDSG